MKREKVLIIKVGYSETLDREISAQTSYGDVLRTTVLLHIFRDAHVTWLVDKKAVPILGNISEIDRLLVPDPLTILQLQAEHFDTVINLEKVPGLCALADSIKAWRRFGFRFDNRLGCAEAYDGTHEVLYLCNDIKTKRSNRKFAQEVLFEMVGKKWGGEEYIFAYRPSGDVKYDIGFNHTVGNKWPTKAWPMEKWKELEKRLAGRFSISWQQGLDNMEDYFEWINSCRMIVTNDSFGLHLGLAMKKKIVALFGSTNHSEVFMYGLGEKVFPKTQCETIPCFEKSCFYKKHCMEDISVGMVNDAVNAVFKGRTVSGMTKAAS